MFLNVDVKEDAHNLKIENLKSNIKTQLKILLTKFKKQKIYNIDTGEFPSKLRDKTKKVHIQCERRKNTKREKTSF